MYGFDFNAPANWYIKLEIMNPDGTLNEDFFSAANMVGWAADGFVYQNVEVNEGNIPDCFYFRITVKFANGTTEIFYTEPYQRRTCENTIIMQGHYDGLDNFGYYHGSPVEWAGSAELTHLTKFLVEGELIHEGFNISHTQVEDETISSRQNEVYRLRLAPVPPYMGKRIANVLSAPSFTIDGITFNRAKSITKNNDEGNMWLIDIELERDNTELNFDCN